MYGKCWHMEDASRVFDALPERNVVSWTTMISSYGQEGYGKMAFYLFQQMQEDGLAPNRVTFLSVLNACDDLAQGKLIHSCCIVNRMMDSMDVAVGNALLSMYGKSGTLDHCFMIFNSMPFRDIISWTAVISIIAQHGEEKVAMHLFRNMQKEGIEPNELTFFSVLNTTVELGALAACRCGSLADACNLFIRLPQRDAVSWTAVISANMLQGNDIMALRLFQQMQLEGVEPAKATFVTILSACASLGALEQGKFVQDHIYTCGLQGDLLVGTALLTMYTKCGSLEDAYIMFKDMPKRDVVAWTTIIAAYAHHGDGAGALILFKKMCLAGFSPNDITLISILCGCSHAGMTDEGHHIFISITHCYCMTPSEDHYHCIIDVLGRGGWVEEAEDFIDQIATSIGIEVWRSFLAACRNHDVVAASSRAADYLISRDPEDPAAYILLANTYATC